MATAYQSAPHGDVLTSSWDHSVPPAPHGDVLTSSWDHSVPPAPPGDVLTSSWDHSVPLTHDNLTLTNRTLFASSRTYDSSQAPREPSSYGRRPSQPASALSIDPSQAEYAKRDSGSATKAERGFAHGTPDPSPTRSHRLRPSASQGRFPVIPASQPRRAEPSELSPEDSAAWIHRDKLARIESQEMAAAGLADRRATQSRQSRSHSRSASRSATRAANTRAQSGDRLAKPPAFSQTPAAPSLPSLGQSPSERSRDDRDEEYEERLQEEPRIGRHYSKSLPRPITSRIPVARASPAPLSQSVVERDSLAAHGGPDAGSVDGDKHIRTRSRSLGSQAAIDGSMKARTPAATPKPRPPSSHVQDSSDSPSVSSSPTKPKQPVKASPGSVARRGTNTKTSVKSRTPTVTPKDSSARRRPTSSNNKSRPTSFHSRPEGDAPWIAHMYKPDPRLPQDQQILPTHAKRMVQQQWDSDGATGDAHDRDFNLLNDNELAKMGAFPTAEQLRRQEEAEAAAEKQQEEAANAQTAQPVQPVQPPWPLSSNNSESKGPSSDAPQGQTQDQDQNQNQNQDQDQDQSKGQAPTTSQPPTRSQPPSRSQAPTGIPQGFDSGYRITPTIESNATHKPDKKHGAPNPQKPVVQRVPDPDEKADGKKKKGLACCVVM